MNQMTIFEALDKPKKVGLLHRCHLYRDGEMVFTAFPSLKGMKLLRIRPGNPMVMDLTVEEYEAFLESEKIRVVNP